MPRIVRKKLTQRRKATQSFLKIVFSASLCVLSSFAFYEYIFLDADERKHREMAACCMPWKGDIHSSMITISETAEAVLVQINFY